MKLNPVISEFPAAMVTTVEAALDAGLFYDTDIHRAVLEGMGGPGCQPVLLREVDLALGDRATERAICEEVKRSPRGTYAILRYHRDDGYVYHRAPMADGTGDLSGHGTNDPFDPTDPAAPAHTLDRMVGYEIYKCRHAVGEARERAEPRRPSGHGLHGGPATHAPALRRPPHLLERHHRRDQPDGRLGRSGDGQAWQPTPPPDHDGRRHPGRRPRRARGAPMRFWRTYRWRLLWSDCWWWIRGVHGADYRRLCRRCGRTGQLHWTWQGCRRFQPVIEFSRSPKHSATL